MVIEQQDIPPQSVKVSRILSVMKYECRIEHACVSAVCEFSKSIVFGLGKNFEILNLIKSVWLPQFMIFHC